MSILVDHQIRKLALDQEAMMLEPFSESVSDGVVSYGLTTAGYDLRLGRIVDIFKNTFNEVINPKGFCREKVFDRLHDLPDHYEVIIPPNGYMLGYSLEYIRMPRWLKGHCTGKSSLARAGVSVNTTPLEGGWHGHLTLEIANLTPCPVMVFVGEGIAQLEFFRVDADPETDYAQKGGQYQFQTPEPWCARVKRK